MELMGSLLGLEEVREKTWGLLTMPWGYSTYSSSSWGGSWMEIKLGTPWELGEEDDGAWGLLLQLRQGAGVEKLASGDLHHGCSRGRLLPLPLLLLLPSPFFSSLPLLLYFSVFWLLT